MPRILVIGYGNTLRGDDGFGPLAASLVEIRKPPGVEVMIVHQLGPEHALDVRAADVVVFLDAAAAGQPGRLDAARVELRDLSPTPHRLDPGSLLALTRAVYAKAPAAVLVTVGGAAFAHGEVVSADVKRAAEKTAEVIVRLAEQGRLDAATLCDAIRA